MMQANKKYV